MKVAGTGRDRREAERYENAVFARIGQLARADFVVATMGVMAGTAASRRLELVVKVIPLLLPVAGILKGRRYTYQWSSMLILLYFIEGVVRTFSNTGLASALARVETGLALVFFLSAMFFAKLSAPIQQTKTPT